MNKVILVGRVGRDPQFITAPNGKLMGQFDVATAEKGKTDWHKIIAWDEAAKISGFLRKGDPVFIEGRLQTRRWTDKAGEIRNEVEVVAWTILPCKGKQETEADFEAQSATEA